MVWCSSSKPSSFIKGGFATRQSCEREATLFNAAIWLRGKYSDGALEKIDKFRIDFSWPVIGQSPKGGEGDNLRAIDQRFVRAGAQDSRCLLDFVNHGLYCTEMDALSRAKIAALLESVCQKIGGDWVLLGGSLITLLVDENRGTQDIDLVRIGDRDKSETASLTELFQVGKIEGFIPESLNTAAGFFLKQITGWQEHILLLKALGLGRIFRPDFTLYVVLKLNRGSDVDLLDIRAAYRCFRQDGFDQSYFERVASAAALKKWPALKTHLGL